MPRKPKETTVTWRPWTTEEDAKAKTLLEQGASYEDIALAVGRSLGAVDGRIKRLRRQGELPQGSRREAAMAGGKALIAKCGREYLLGIAQKGRDVITSQREAKKQRHEEQGYTELTEREMKALLLLLSGRRRDQIAAEMGIARTTVEGYRSLIYRKLGVHSRAQAFTWARKNGVV